MVVYSLDIKDMSNGSSEKCNLKERAYKIIKEKIINCELAPGEILNEEKLKEEIQSSRTPIREALNRLEQEKLVKIVSKKGIFVSDITIKNIIDIFQVRELIDPYITEIATPVMSEKKLLHYKKLFNNCDTTDYVTFIKLDTEFHNSIAESSKNSYLIQLSQNLYAQNQRIRILSTILPRRLEESNEEHLRIINYMLMRDAKKAAMAMKEHIAMSRDTAFKITYAKP